MFIFILFWLLMVLWLIGGVGWAWPRDRFALGNSVVAWVLFAILGFAVLGNPLTK